MHLNLECPDLPHKSHLFETDSDLEGDAPFLVLGFCHGDADGILKAWLRR